MGLRLPYNACVFVYNMKPHSEKQTQIHSPGSTTTFENSSHSSFGVQRFSPSFPNHIFCINHAWCASFSSSLLSELTPTRIEGLTSSRSVSASSPRQPGTYSKRTNLQCCILYPILHASIMHEEFAGFLPSPVYLIKCTIQFAGTLVHS